MLPVALLAWFLFASWFAATRLQTDIGLAAFWPAGWATMALLVASDRLRPAVVAILGVAIYLIASERMETGLALGWAVAVCLETVMAAAILSEAIRIGRRPDLKSNRDLMIFLAAGLFSAVAGSLVVATVGFAAGRSEWQWDSVAYVVNHASGQWVLLPFLARMPNYERQAGWIERVLMVVVFAGLGALTLTTLDIPMLIFLYLPLLTWVAVRTTALEAQVAVLALSVVVALSTASGLGPFAGLVPDSNPPLGVENVVANIFLVSCLLVVLTLSIAIGQQRDEAQRAYVELERMASIVRSSHGVAIVGTDQSGEITLFNPGAERLLGFTAAEMIGTNASRLFTSEPARALMREFGAHTAREFIELIADPGLHGLDMQFVRKDGTERTVSMTLSRVVDKRGRLSGYVSTAEDVTERVEAASLLRDALNAERQAVEQLQEIDAVKDAFVSSVSHELRTPLTSISGYLELLADGSYGDLTDAQLDALRRISDNARRLLALIDDLLTLSRVEQSGRGIAVETFDLCEAIRSGFEVVRPQWETRDLVARLLIGVEELPLRGNRNMVERIVVNLLGNAVKFTPDGGWVTVELGSDGNQAVLLVSDSGIGIPPADLERLFERFFRSPGAEAAAIPGSGLGLSITRAMVDKHHGRITVTSEAGVGTTFEVRLPLVSASDHPALEPPTRLDSPWVQGEGASPAAGELWGE